MTRENRIKLLKSSIDVSGNPLLDSKWTDEEIGQQIDTLMNQKEFSCGLYSQTKRVYDLVNEPNRKYKPSKDSSKRLYRRYMEILMLEGVSSFIFDW